MAGILDKTRCYLIGSMEFGDGSKWREDVTKELSKMGIVSFDPYKKPFIDNSLHEGNDQISALRSQITGWKKENMDCIHKSMKAIRSSDLNLVDRSDFIIYYLNPKVPSYGSLEEFFSANSKKKPIFVVIEGGKENTPLWLLGTLPPNYFYDSINSVLEIINNIDSGKVEIDSRRWRLLKPEYR